MINFINSHWVPCHVTMGLFEATYTIRVTMTTHVKDLLSSYFLCDKLITYVMNEGDNLWGWQITHKKLWPYRGNKNIKRIRRMILFIGVSIFAFLSISLNKHVASLFALDWKNCVKLNNPNLTLRQQINRQLINKNLRCRMHCSFVHCNNLLTTLLLHAKV